ncbi:MAG: CYTH domain-containing protein [Oscillibacter sp.]|nr:CYTH domain-containing protein [Oscillibacter sp.]
MNHQEIERKFKVARLPEDLEQYPRRRIEQGYLSTAPVVRVRRDNGEYYLTYKGAGVMVKEEYNLPLTREAYRHLLEKADGLVIRKDRFCIPFGAYTIELDRFDPPFAPLLIAEVEFPTEAEALAFQPPDWFGEEVTGDRAYSNAQMSRKAPE